MKNFISKEMIKKDKEIKKMNLKMEKNIEEVIKYFELEEKISNFLDEALSKQKKYSPDLNQKAIDIINEEINKILKIETLKILIENAVTQVVSDIAYKIFEEKKEQLKQDFIDDMNYA